MEKYIYIFIIINIIIIINPIAKFLQNEDADEGRSKQTMKRVREMYMRGKWLGNATRNGRKGERENERVRW